MSHDDVLLDLENRLCDLEFAAFKDRWNSTGKPSPAPKKNTGSTRTAPAKKNDWTLHFHKKPDGSQEYHLRSASGVMTKLPADRKLWPQDVRETTELFETFDKQRRIGGHSTATARGTCEIR
jgi:hypothetical protein